MTDRRRRLLWMPVAVAVVAGGCSFTESYRPKSPVAAHAPLADVEVDRLDRGEGLTVEVPKGRETTGGTTLRLRWRAREDGSGIARAVLASPEARPCTAGVSAQLIDVDGQTRWDRPVGLGRDHVVTLSFPEEPILMTGALVLDVEAARADGSTACVRMPLTDGGRGFVTQSHALLGVRLGLQVPLRAGSTSAFSVELTPGRWLGPLRLTLGLGMAVGVSRLNTGDSDSNNDSSTRPQFVMLHAAPEIAFFPLVRGPFAFGVEVACELAAGSSGAGTMKDPDRDESYVAPRVALLGVSSRLRPPGTSVHQLLSGQGFELFALRATSWPGDTGRGAAYAVGLGAVTWW
jgi:hypothetical protein